MARFVFRCPHCGRRVRAVDTMAGRTLKCPACRQVTTVPAAGGEALQETHAVGGAEEPAQSPSEAIGSARQETQASSPASPPPLQPAAKGLSGGQTPSGDAPAEDGANGAEQSVTDREVMETRNDTGQLGKSRLSIHLAVGVAGALLLVGIVGYVAISLTGGSGSLKDEPLATALRSDPDALKEALDLQNKGEFETAYKVIFKYINDGQELALMHARGQDGQFVVPLDKLPVPRAYLLPAHQGSRAGDQPLAVSWRGPI